jgi:hypothetical protein
MTIRPLVQTDWLYPHDCGMHTGILFGGAGLHGRDIDPSRTFLPICPGPILRMFPEITKEDTIQLCLYGVPVKGAQMIFVRRMTERANPNYSWQYGPSESASVSMYMEVNRFLSKKLGHIHPHGTVRPYWLTVVASTL